MRSITRFRHLAIAGAGLVASASAVVIPATVAHAGAGAPPGFYQQLCAQTHTPCDADGYPVGLDKKAIIAHCGYLPPPFSDCDGVVPPTTAPPTTVKPKPHAVTPTPNIDAPVKVKPAFTG